MSNLHFRRDSAKFNLHEVQQHLTCSGVGGGFCLAKLAAAEQTGAGLLLAALKESVS